MIKRIATTFALIAIALLCLPTMAGEGKTIELTGYITDEYCGANNANAEGVACIKACAEKGPALMVYSDGKLYKISDKEMALSHLGYKVVVKGTVDEENVVTPSSIEKAEKA